MRYTVRRGTAAFSLVEVIVAIGVLVPVIIVALGIFPFSHIINHRCWDIVAASDLAQQQLEQLRSTSFDKLPATGTATSTQEGVDFQCNVTVVPYGAPSPLLLKKATARVTWHIQKDESLQFDTLIVKSTGP